jgi:hypothetical protein
MAYMDVLKPGHIQAPTPFVLQLGVQAKSYNMF